jgi:hypothetical protein
MRSLTITLEGVPDELHAMTATPEGMARARAAVLDAFGMEEEDEIEEDLSTIPDILMKVSPNALKKAQADIDAGKGIAGDDFLAELRRPLAD